MLLLHASGVEQYSSEVYKHNGVVICLCSYTPFLEHLLVNIPERGVLMRGAGGMMIGSRDVHQIHKIHYFWYTTERNCMQIALYLRLLWVMITDVGSGHIEMDIHNIFNMTKLIVSCVEIKRNDILQDFVCSSS